MRQTITATLERVRYRKDENGWGIYQTNMGKCVGVIPWEPAEGGILKLDGEFQTSEFDGGQEFRFRAAYPALPEDSRALLSYAISLTKGLGPKREKEIWKKYGDAWKNTAELDLPGITESIKWFWTDTLGRLKDEKLQSDTFGWLLSKGCSMNMATAAWKKWTATTYGVVDANPYSLADLPRYGFGDVDRAIRQKFGIADRDWRRIDAAILYVLKNRITDGSTFVPWTQLETELATVVGDAQDLFETSLDRLINELKRVVKTIGTDGEPGYSLAEDAENEWIVFERFRPAHTTTGRNANEN